MNTEKGSERPALCSEGTPAEEGRSRGTRHPWGCHPALSRLRPALPAPSPLAVESDPNLVQLITAPALLLLRPEKFVGCQIISMHIRSPPAAPAHAPSLSIPTSATTAWARHRNKGVNGGRIPPWGAPFPLEVGAGAGWTRMDGRTHTHSFYRSFQLSP